MKRSSVISTSAQRSGNEIKAAGSASAAGVAEASDSGPGSVKEKSNSISVEAENKLTEVTTVTSQDPVLEDQAQKTRKESTADAAPKVLRRNSLTLKNTATDQGSVFDIRNKKDIYRRNSLSVFFEEAFGIFTKGEIKSSKPSSPGLGGNIPRAADPAASSKLLSSPSLSSITAVVSKETVAPIEVESDSKTVAETIKKNNLETALLKNNDNTTPITSASTTTPSVNLTSDTTSRPATPSTPRPASLASDLATRTASPATTSITGEIPLATPNTTEPVTSNVGASLTSTSSTTSNSPEVDITELEEENDNGYVFKGIDLLENQIINTHDDPTLAKNLLKSYIEKTRALLDQKKVSLEEYNNHIHEFLETLETSN